MTRPKCEVCIENPALHHSGRKIGKVWYEAHTCSRCTGLPRGWFRRLYNAREGVGKRRVMANYMRQWNPQATWEDFKVRVVEWEGE